MSKCSVYEVVLLILGQFACLAKPEAEEGIKQLHQVCLYLSKMVYFDYQLLTSHPRQSLACGLVFVGLKIVEQVNKAIDLDL